MALVPKISQNDTFDTWRQKQNLATDIINDAQIDPDLLSVSNPQQDDILVFQTSDSKFHNESFATLVDTQLADKHIVAISKGKLFYVSTHDNLV